MAVTSSYSIGCTVVEASVSSSRDEPTDVKFTSLHLVDTLPSMLLAATWPG